MWKVGLPIFYYDRGEDAADFPDRNYFRLGISETLGFVFEKFKHKDFQVLNIVTKRYFYNLVEVKKTLLLLLFSLY